MPMPPTHTTAASSRTATARWALLLLAATGGIVMADRRGGLLPRAAVAGDDTRGPDDRTRAKQLQAMIPELRPLHRKLAAPKPGDWLDQHDEPGQTFTEYLRSRPVRPDARRRTIYIQPLGQFTRTQRRIVELTADFMGRYFELPVKISEDLPLSLIPDRARRVHPQWKVQQILSTYVLEEVLKPRLPEDAVVLIALTPSDLWPGEGWNFVFGQAMLRDRVGVWSLARNGDPDAGESALRLCLLRTLKTATHETGHMFGLWHCTAYECNMCGSNHRQESDRRPIALCPECVAKLCWAVRCDPVARYRKLAEFCKAHGLKDEAAYYDKALAALGAAPASRPAK